MTESQESELFERARRWAAEDPDPVTRAEIEGLLAARAESEIAERFAAELDFGTAGLRGEVGAGPARMNQAVVIRAARALAEHLLAKLPDARALPVVVGYDARLSSRGFAEAMACVLLAAGLNVRWFDEPAPTPLVAYAARRYAAAAAVVVTASHNPRQDNGVKVYGHDARQLVAPDDADVARRRDALGGAASIPRVEFASRKGAFGARLEVVEPGLAERYFDELEASLPARLDAPALCVAYTPLHGVGLTFARRALERRGFRELHVVSEQAEPDGAFPTLEFPNPEQAGTLDRVLALAAEKRADLVLANDPDADRLAAAARDGDGALRVLTGNELGVLLADFVLSETQGRPARLLVTSVVSSPLLVKVALAHGVRAELTLTGFKWIWAAARALEASAGLHYVYGCEEALGYSIGGLVRDKDGISGAVWLSELAERCRRRGETLIERLHAIYAQHGAWASAQRSLVKPLASGLAAIRSAIERLSAEPPSSLAGLTRSGFFDYRTGAESRAPWCGASALLELSFGEGARVLVRPSGTEPKLKIYADACIEPAAGETIAAAAARANYRARGLADELARWLDGAG